MNKESLKIIHNELYYNRQQQQSDVDIIYNKFNWIAVSDLLVISCLLNIENKNFFIYITFILISLSLFISLYAIKLKTFKRGPELSELIQASNVSEEDLLNALNIKIVDAVEKNNKTIEWFAKCLKYSIFLLIVGIVSIVLYYFLPIITNLILIICLCIIQII